MERGGQKTNVVDYFRDKNYLVMISNDFEQRWWVYFAV